MVKALCLNLILMFHAPLNKFDRQIGLRGETSRERIFLVEQLAAFIPRMPWVYAILIVNLGGLMISLGNQFTYLVGAGIPVLLLVGARLIHWLRLPRQAISELVAVTELRRAVIIGSIITSSYCAWILAIYAESSEDAQSHVILFGALAAIGCSYALSPMPTAAKVPLVFLGLPLALVLIASADPAHAAMGIALVTLLFVTLKINEAQNVTFTRLVNSRIDVELEKQRAEAAERSALIERSLARKLADTDVLTGLGNRRALLAEIDMRTRADRGPFAVALLDLDGFKAINDTFGHSTGDELLVAVSRRLSDLFKDKGFVARLGGDEFAILLTGAGEREAGRLVGEAIERIAQPYRHHNRNLVVSACAGVAFCAASESDPTQTIRMADIALFTAKRKGRGTVELFSDALELDVKRRAEIEMALRAPGVENEIELAYQPIVDLESMAICSFEALARWRHSELGWISPSEFIPITEQISVVERISEALLARAAAEALRWPSSIRLSFNLSAVQLCSEASAHRILQLVEEAGLAPARLQLEVTETALLGDFDAARRNLSHLSRAGVRLALDDFGAGYASISYLREMSFDAVKLDGTLVSAASADRAGTRLLQGVLDLCRAVELPCIAEHVETEQQVQLLRGMGCQYGQGFWLARPMSAEQARQAAYGDRIAFAPTPALKKVSHRAR